MLPYTKPLVTTNSEIAIFSVMVKVTRSFTLESLEGLHL